MGACRLMLAGCMPQFGAPPAAPTGDLRSARLACNAEYPRGIGNYGPHAECVNAAVERYAMPTARHPDLLRLQEELRRRLSDKVDRQQISPAAAARKMAEADALIRGAERERDAGRDAAAHRKAARVEAMLR